MLCGWRWWLFVVLLWYYVWIGFCIGIVVGKGNDDVLVVFWLWIVVDVVYWWNVKNVGWKGDGLYLGYVFGVCCGLFGDVGRDSGIELWDFFWSGW